jgi:hypothetical protein
VVVSDVAGGAVCGAVLGAAVGRGGDAIGAHTLVGLAVDAYEMEPIIACAALVLVMYVTRDSSPFMRGWHPVGTLAHVRYTGDRVIELAEALL